MKLFYKIVTITTLVVAIGDPVISKPKNLSLPEPDLCAARKINQRIGKSSFYVSWLEKDTRNLFLNWLDARNWCRDRCMDLISLESSEEIQMVKNLMKKHRIEYCWTSGRLCNFGGCDRKDLQPIDKNGWFWSATDVKMRPTDEKSSLNDWSSTGGLRLPQPDNREGKQKGGQTEACMAVLNNQYKDGIKWHDVACHHIKSFICEDNAQLLAYARSINKNKNLRF